MDTPADKGTPVAESRHKKKPWWRRYLAVPTLIAIAVLVYLVFFGEKSVTQRVQYQTVIDSLENALAQQQDSLRYYQDLNRRLSSDPDLMEKVAREQYNMKRTHEDVFIVK